MLAGSAPKLVQGEYDLPRPMGSIGETKLKILAIVYFNDEHRLATYGYDVWRTLKRTFNVYLDVGNLRNVYHHLKELEELGLVSRNVPQSAIGAPRRQPYNLTGKGRMMTNMFARYLNKL